MKITTAESGVSVLHSMSERTASSIADQISRAHGIEIFLGKPQVICIETIRKSAEAEGKYIRQTGGMGNYGHVKIRLGPNEPDEGVEFISVIQGDVIPKEYIKPIEQGIREAALGGILGGYEVVDFKAILYDGSYHEVDSNEMAFKIAASLAFKEAARKASLVLLEPVMAVEVMVPEQHMGTILAGINSRGGRIEAIEHVGGSQVIKAMVPLNQLLGYANDLQTSTHGGASCTMEFARYEEVRPGGMPGDYETGVPVIRPQGPGPRTNDGAVDPDADWS